MDRTERMRWGEQFIVANVPQRAIPTGKLRPSVPQAPIAELPLFSGDDHSDQLEIEARGSTDEAER